MLGTMSRNLEEVLRETHRIARENVKGTPQRTKKKDYDVKLKPVIYEIDDFVHKLNSASTKGVSKKNLFSVYDGPFIVTRIHSPILI